ncbi:TMV resistance protein N-like [Dorcoceras hygrometricum]|uniref:TMV resistance protein N-like n=1 Tax=Dorcoceras hygrometricum TaxID=472368 RepID=A0A2Z7D3Z1_9LAMI|nr:TMV resistance protein N-like [Dorcoceras hygrometricum]
MTSQRTRGSATSSSLSETQGSTTICLPSLPLPLLSDNSGAHNGKHTKAGNHPHYQKLKARLQSAYHLYLYHYSAITQGHTMTPQVDSTLGLSDLPAKVCNGQTHGQSSTNGKTNEGCQEISGIKANDSAGKSNLNNLRNPKLRDSADNHDSVKEFGFSGMTTQSTNHVSLIIKFQSTGTQPTNHDSVINRYQGN